MMTAAASGAVMVIGVLVCAASAWGIVAPSNLMAVVRDVMQQSWAMSVAVGVRVLLGVALIFAAPGSKYPQTLEVLGWIAIVAAGALIVVGRERIVRLLTWAQRLPFVVVRAWMLFGIAFGAFLVWATA